MNLDMKKCQGRYAGKKVGDGWVFFSMGVQQGPGLTPGQAIVVKAFDDGSKQRPFGHCMVAGIDRAPLKVTRHGPHMLI